MNRSLIVMIALTALTALTACETSPGDVGMTLGEGDTSVERTTADCDSYCGYVRECSPTTQTSMSCIDDCPVNGRSSTPCSDEYVAMTDCINAIGWSCIEIEAFDLGDPHAAESFVCKAEKLDYYECLGE